MPMKENMSPLTQLNMSTVNSKNQSKPVKMFMDNVWNSLAAYADEIKGNTFTVKKNPCVKLKRLSKNDIKAAEISLGIEINSDEEFPDLGPSLKTYGVRAAHNTNEQKEDNVDTEVLGKIPKLKEVHSNLSVPTEKPQVEEDADRKDIMREYITDLKQKWHGVDWKRDKTPSKLLSKDSATTPKATPKPISPENISGMTSEEMVTSILQVSANIFPTIQLESTSDATSESTKGPSESGDGKRKHEGNKESSKRPKIVHNAMENLQKANNKWHQDRLDQKQGSPIANRKNQAAVPTKVIRSLNICGDDRDTAVDQSSQKTSFITKDLKELVGASSKAPHVRYLQKTADKSSQTVVNLEEPLKQSLPSSGKQGKTNHIGTQASATVISGDHYDRSFVDVVTEGDANPLTDLSESFNPLDNLFSTMKVLKSLVEVLKKHKDCIENEREVIIKNVRTNYDDKLLSLGEEIKNHESLFFNIMNAASQKVDPKDESAVILREEIDKVLNTYRCDAKKPENRMCVLPTSTEQNKRPHDTVIVSCDTATNSITPTNSPKTTDLQPINWLIDLDSSLNNDVDLPFTLPPINSPSSSSYDIESPAYSPASLANVDANSRSSSLNADSDSRNSPTLPLQYIESEQVKASRNPSGKVTPTPTDNPLLGRIAIIPEASVSNFGKRRQSAIKKVKERKQTSVMAPSSEHSVGKNVTSGTVGPSVRKSKGKDILIKLLKGSQASNNNPLAQPKSATAFNGNTSHGSNDRSSQSVCNPVTIPSCNGQPTPNAVVGDNGITALTNPTGENSSFSYPSLKSADKFVNNANLQQIPIVSHSTSGNQEKSLSTMSNTKRRVIPQFVPNPNISRMPTAVTHNEARIMPKLTPRPAYQARCPTNAAPRHMNYGVRQQQYNSSVLNQERTGQQISMNQCYQPPPLQNHNTQQRLNTSVTLMQSNNQPRVSQPYPIQIQPQLPSVPINSQQFVAQNSSFVGQVATAPNSNQQVPYPQYVALQTPQQLNAVQMIPQNSVPQMSNCRIINPMMLASQSGNVYPSPAINQTSGQVQSLPSPNQDLVIQSVIGGVNESEFEESAIQPAPTTKQPPPYTSTGGNMSQQMPFRPTNELQVAQNKYVNTGPVNNPVYMYGMPNKVLLIPDPTSQANTTVPSGVKASNASTTECTRALKQFRPIARASTSTTCAPPASSQHYSPQPNVVVMTSSDSDNCDDIIPITCFLCGMDAKFTCCGPFRYCSEDCKKLDLERHKGECRAYNK